MAGMTGVSMLTDKGIKAFKATDKPQKMKDFGGLYLYITPLSKAEVKEGEKPRGGAMVWRLKYRHGGKEKLLVLGRYPAISLKEARKLRDQAKEVLAAGKDPSLEAKRVKLIGDARAVGTFEKHARAWYDKTKTRWKPVHADDVITSMENDLFPAIGAYPITDIDKPLLLAALKKVEDRGSIETARRLLQRASRVFKYADALGADCGNPAEGMIEALSSVPKKQKWPAIVVVEDLRTLIRDVDSAGAMPTTKLASRFTALTAQRPGMIRRMPWAHIHDVDWARPDEPSPDAMWIVPSAEMKLEFDLRGNQDCDHKIPLAQAAVDTLHAARLLTGRGPLAFPSAWDGSDPMSENTINYLYGRIGYKGRQVPHGWRSSFSTIMNSILEREFRKQGMMPGTEKMNIDRLIVDLMLAHKPIGMSEEEFTYNRSAYMDRRREIAEQWAALIMEGAMPAAEVMNGRRRSNYR